MRRYLILFFAGAILLVLSGCGPNPTYNYYVSLSGNDSALCISADTPCLTLAGALEKARALHTSFIEAADGEPSDFTIVIHVAAGTYNVTAPLAGDHFANVDFNLSVIGAGPDSTIFDAGNTYSGILVEGDVRIDFRDFTIQNVRGTSLDGCIHTLGSVHGLIEDVIVQRCLGVGIIHNSELLADTPLELVDVISRQNVANPVRPPGLAGVGVINNGAMQILYSTISHNENIGVVSQGNILIGETLVELNNGSGLFLRGQADLDRVNIRSNGLVGCIPDSSSPDPCGEGSPAGIRVFDAADVSILSSPITRNLFGIYIDSSEATVRLVSSTVGASRLTGVYVKQGTFQSSESDILGNATAYLDGEYSRIGGLYVGDGAEAAIEETRVDGNKNGGIQNDGVLDALDSSISENTGGLRAIQNDGTATLANTLIGNNQQTEAISGSPGAVSNGDTMDLVNVTISQNLGLGLLNTGSLTMAYSTIAFNDSTGLAINAFSGEPSPSTNVENSIILGNIGNDCTYGVASWAPVTSGFNIETFSSCGFEASQSDVPLVLEELADNGGFTMTNALVPGSPALDAAQGDCPATDQRLVVRPFGSACDVGAYEASEMTTTLPLVAATATPDVPLLIVLQDSGCFYGPGLDWPRYGNLSVGTQAEIVGQGLGGGWMVIKHPTIANTNCWIDIDHVDFDIPLDELRLISIPARPTPAATATKDAREPTACPTNPQIPGTCQ